MRPPKMSVIVGWLAAAAITGVLGTFFHTQSVLSDLVSVGAEIPQSVWIETTLADLVGLGPVYAAVIALAFAIGFATASLVKRVLRPLAPVAYPIAGAAAVAAALTVMGIAYDGITPIAGARGVLGMGLQCLAGAIGGLLFTAIARPQSRN